MKNKICSSALLVLTLVVCLTACGSNEPGTLTSNLDMSFAAINDYSDQMNSLGELNDIEYESSKPNDSNREAQLIELNNLIQGNLDESSNDYFDTFKIVVHSIGQVTLNLEAPSGTSIYIESDRTGYVFAGDLSQKIENIVFEIVIPGTYYVTVYSHNDSFGDYKFSLENSFDPIAEYANTYDDYYFQVSDDSCIQVTADQAYTIENGNYSQGTCLSDSGLDIVGSCPVSLVGTADFYYELSAQDICRAFF